ncbi:MAG TPA: SRPBCC domain-containing protein [Ktedonosporobacter sp.]|nr:SRPBCC domain-containing protein [Ktedonosporobacter sp.]
MKFNGSHKFKVNSATVFNAVLNPDILKASIPGAQEVNYVDANTLRVSITTELPVAALKGPHGVTINIANRQAPNYIELRVARQGKGGSVNAVSQIQITDEPDGALLTYDANADLEGTIAIVNNPIGSGIAKKSLDTFFKNLDKAIV